MHVELVSLLMKHGCSDTKIVEKIVISECSLSILQLRDRLFLLGNILYEDLERQVYVATVRAGFCDMSNSVVAMRLQGNRLYIAGYAKEGVIKQNICEQAFRKIADAARGKEIVISSKQKRIFLPILALVIVIATVAVCRKPVAPEEVVHPSETSATTEKETTAKEATLSPEELAFIAEVEQTIEATKAYNAAVEAFNLRADEYNAAVLQANIDNIVGLPSSIEYLVLVSESYEDNVAVIQGDNSKEKIAVDTKTVLMMAFRIEQATLVVKQITAPSGEWVMDRLRVVESITGMQAVTEELNPDGLLDKEGGYSDCIYFTVAAAIPNVVPGDSIVAKGTDAGGAIEIYPTLADAEARVAYLAGFDGTVLYSGSYAIVGTMVIRTSYKLTNEQQFDLTYAITNALTALSQTE